VVYDAVCYQGNDGFFYISITEFIIVVLAFIMLTLRVAFSEFTVLDTEDEGLNKEEAASDKEPIVGLNEDKSPSDEGAEEPVPVKIY